MLIFAYFSPETLLPVTSIVAAGAGVVLMFGRNTFRLMARVCRRVLPRRGWVESAKGPRAWRSHPTYSEPARR